jgi:large conductance mechanosensitive channel
MGFFEEFKKFIGRGNVLDLAVGVIIGAAFGKIVTSLTEAVIMPVIGWIFGALDFSNWFIRLGAIPPGYKGSPTNYAALKEAGVPMLGYGDLLTQLVNFLIVAFALFLLIRTVNKMLDEVHARQKAEEKAAEAPSDPQLDVLKDILKELRAGKGAKG